MKEKFELDESYARRLDSEDKLAKFRESFYVPDETIYMDGNSLGLMCKNSRDSVLRVLDEWAMLGVRGWLEAKRPWFYFSERLGAMCASLVGAAPDEVVVSGTTTVNIHQLVNTFYRPSGKRRKIIADELDFPSDIYALRSIMKLRGANPDRDLILAPSADGRLLNEKKLVELMDDSVALVFLP